MIGMRAVQRIEDRVTIDLISSTVDPVPSDFRGRGIDGAERDGADRQQAAWRQFCYRDPLAADVRPVERAEVTHIERAVADEQFAVAPADKRVRDDDRRLTPATDQGRELQVKLLGLRMAANDNQLGIQHIVGTAQRGGCEIRSGRAGETTHSAGDTLGSGTDSIAIVADFTAEATPWRGEGG